MKCRNFMHILISYYIIVICLSKKKIKIISIMKEMVNNMQITIDYKSKSIAM